MTEIQSCKNSGIKQINECTSIDMSISFSVDDFPCPLWSIATTLAFSLIARADKANDSLIIAYQKKKFRKFCVLLAK